MARYTDLLVKIRADIGDFKGKMRELNADLAKASNDANKASIGFQKLGQSLSSVGAGMTFSITAPIAALTGAALKASASMETAKTAFTTMLKSSQAAQQQLDKLKAFALQTPFEFPELIDASRKMMALGFSAEEVLPNLKDIGDAVSALGLGAEGMQRVILALGQIRSKGVVQAQEMKQLAEAGIPAWDALARKLGVDVATAMKMVEERAVASQLAIDAVREYIQTRFGGGMEAQAKTLIGTWQRVREQITFALVDIGDAVAPAARRLIDEFLVPATRGASELAKSFRELPAPVQKATLEIIGLAAAIGPAAWGIGKIVSALAALKAAPAAAIAVGAAAAATAYIGIVAAIDTVIEKRQQLHRLQPPPGLIVRQSDVDILITLRDVLQDIVKGPFASMSRQAESVGNFKTITNKLADATKSVYQSMSLSNDQLEQYSGKAIKATKDTETLAASVETAKLEFRGLRESLDKIEANEAIERFANDWVALTGEVINFNTKTVEAARAAAEFVIAADFEGVDDKIRTAAEVMDEFTQSALEAASAAGQIQFPNLNPPVNVTDLGESIIKGQWDEIDRQARIAGESMSRAGQKSRKALLEVSTVVTDLSRGITKLIFEGGKWGDVMKGVAREIGEALVRNVLEAALKPILKAITDIIAKAFGMKNALGGVSMDGSGVSVPTGGVKTTSSGAGSAATGLTGWVNMATGIVTAVSSVISNFQQYAMNKSLDLIEHNTRYGQLYTLAILDKINIFLPGIEGLNARLNEIRTYGVGVYPQEGWAWAGPGGGSSFEYYQNAPVYGGPSGIKELTDLIVTELRRRGVRI